MAKKKEAITKHTTDSAAPALSGLDVVDESNTNSAPIEETESLNKAKEWNPYRVVFTSVAKGFELGEHYVFRQRIFCFKEKPDAEVIATLKEAGFIYRPYERTWTIPADYASRRISDTLARRFADEQISVSM